MKTEDDGEKDLRSSQAYTCVIIYLCSAKCCCMESAQDNSYVCEDRYCRKRFKGQIKLLEFDWADLLFWDSVVSLGRSCSLGQ